MAIPIQKYGRRYFERDRSLRTIVLSLGYNRDRPSKLEGFSFLGFLWVLKTHIWYRQIQNLIYLWHLSLPRGAAHNHTVWCIDEASGPRVQNITEEKEYCKLTPCANEGWQHLIEAVSLTSRRCRRDTGRVEGICEGALQAHNSG
jgi:hypothetical protein